MPKAKQTASKSTKKFTGDITCSACGSTKKYDEFYTSNSVLHAATSRIPICKECVKKKGINDVGSLDVDNFKSILKSIDKPFINTLLQSAFNGIENNEDGASVIGEYMKNINSMPQYKKLTWSDSKFDDADIKENKSKSFTEDDLRNKDDIIRLLKYDPFVDEKEDVKSYLYNRLIDFLDENTLTDSFKLPIVIEMVKGFGQAERINRALSKLDIVNDPTKVKDIKTLSDTKTNILRAILSMAKDNGISENYSNNKSKGAGTLSGIIKDLQEKGIHNSDVNLYDIETCDGMRQVADISNKSILDQLMLNENDYVDMIKDQRALLQELNEKIMKFEEENRQLKVKIKLLEQRIKEKSV